MRTRTFAFLGVAVLVVSTCGILVTRADEGSKNSDGKAATQKDSSEKYAALGVAIEPMQPGMSGHFSKLLADGQGVIVRHVAPDSAAEKAGLKQNDIIAEYGDQRIFSVVQLHKLIMSDKPGKEMDVQFVRSGQMNTAKVTLGEATREMARSFAHRMDRDFVWPHLGERLLHRSSQIANSNDSGWDHFDSMTLKRQKDGTFQAEINYRDKDGKMAHHTFQGSRDEIERAIKSEKDLPGSERNHLLHGFGTHMIFMPGSFDGQGDFRFDLPFYDLSL